MHIAKSLPWASKRRRSALVALALVASASASAFPPAAALAKAPSGDFAIFKQCPRYTSGVTLCLYSETLSGAVTLHKETVPITGKLVVQGGIKENPVTGAESFVAPLSGQALVASPQEVPGGVFGIGGTETNSKTAVKVIAELVRPASDIGIDTHNLESQEGVVLSLPLRLRLENPLFGGECFIGSSTNPVTLALTAGATHPNAPNKSISGKSGSIAIKDGFEFIEVTQNTMVDNEFTAPEATGCRGSSGISFARGVNSKVGLPAPDGYNTAIMNSFIRESGVPGILESER